MKYFFLIVGAAFIGLADISMPPATGDCGASDQTCGTEFGIVRVRF